MGGITNLIKRLRKKNNQPRNYGNSANTSYWDKPEILYYCEQDVDAELFLIYTETANVWNDVLSGLGVRLVPTDNALAADVLLQGWRPANEERFGKTNIWNRDVPNYPTGRAPSGIRVRCIIELNAARRDRDKDKIRAVVLHEWGHVLGIDGDLHSPDKGDIMHATTYVSTLSDADKHTMQQIYKEKR